MMSKKEIILASIRAGKTYTTLAEIDPIILKIVLEEEEE